MDTEANKSTALVLYSPSACEKPYKTEYIRPIKPDVSFSAEGFTESTPPNTKKRGHDFIFAFLIGLGIFGFAAWAVFDMLMSAMLMFL